MRKAEADGVGDRPRQHVARQAVAPAGPAEQPQRGVQVQARPVRGDGERVAVKVLRLVLHGAYAVSTSVLASSLRLRVSANRERSSVE